MREQFASTQSDKNSSLLPLGASETFTGKWEDVGRYDSIAFAIKVDATCTMYVDFTSDYSGAVTDSTLTYKIAANINEVHKLTVTRRFFRIRVVNNTTPQTYLSLSCMLGYHPALTAPMNLNVSLDADATTVRPTSFEDEVVIGRRTGVTSFTKFAYKSNLTAASGEETIWEASGNFTPMASASTFTITYNNATDGTGGTGAKTLYFQYVDSTGLPAISVHTLGGTGSDVTSFSGLGINRIAVSSSGAAMTNTNDIIVTSTVGGTTQATVPALNGVTQQLIYHVGSNSQGVGKFLWINANKISGRGSPRIIVKGYVYNRNVATRFEIFRCIIDTGIDNSINIVEPVGFRLNPSDILYFVADTDTNNTAINVRFSLLEYERE